jgi:apolipoprotein N-acyltransferase
MLFLAGLLFLIATNSFWPGILLLIGLAHYVKQSARGRGGRAIRNIVFWGGLAFLFWTHMFWPGILMLLVASSLFGHRGYAWRP